MPQLQKGAKSKDGFGECVWPGEEKKKKRVSREEYFKMLVSHLTSHICNFLLIFYVWE